MKNQADEVLAVRVPPQLKSELRRLAGDDKRTLSNFVELLLTEALAARQSKEAAA